MGSVDRRTRIFRKPYNAVDFISVSGKGLKGNTVRGDLAVKYMSGSKVSADFKVSGSLGKMQGGASRIQIGYVW